jgi:IS30 family transposase
MPARRELTMRQLRQLLRLHHDGVSARKMACELGVARSTIRDNLKRAAAAGLHLAAARRSERRRPGRAAVLSCRRASGDPP